MNGQVAQQLTLNDDLDASEGESTRKLLENEPLSCRAKGMLDWFLRFGGLARPSLRSASRSAALDAGHRGEPPRDLNFSLDGLEVEDETTQVSCFKTETGSYLLKKYSCDLPTDHVVGFTQQGVHRALPQREAVIVQEDLANTWSGWW